MPAADVFSALASPTRRKILELLLDGPLSAGAIASRFDLNRPAVSEHVHVLRATGLVTEEGRGRHRFYHLSPGPLSAVGEWMKPFEHYWRARLRALARTLSEEKET